MNLLKFLAVGSMALFFVGCSDPLTKAEAQKAWPTTNKTMYATNATHGALLSALTLSAGYSLPCPQEGKLKFTVSADIADIHPESGEFAFGLEFNDCGADNMVINGDLDWKFNVETSANESTLTWGWEGDLSYDGAIEGDCEIKTQGKITASAGTTGGDPTSASVEYSGKICDYEANFVATAGASNP